MARLIDADVMRQYWLENGENEYVYDTNAVLESIDAQPAVDAVPVVHGRWEWLGPNRLVPECMCGTCSACKVRTKYIVNKDLCPNCGAKMDLE